MELSRAMMPDCIMGCIVSSAGRSVVLILSSVELVRVHGTFLIEELKLDEVVKSESEKKRERDY